MPTVLAEEPLSLSTFALACAPLVYFEEIIIPLLATTVLLRRCDYVYPVPLTHHPKSQTLIHILSQGLLEKFLAMIAMGRLFAFRPWKKALLPCVFLHGMPAWLSEIIAIIHSGAVSQKNSLAKVSTKWKTDAKTGWLVPQPPMAPLKGAYSWYGHPCSTGALHQSSVPAASLFSTLVKSKCKFVSLRAK